MLWPWEEISLAQQPNSLQKLVSDLETTRMEPPKKDHRNKKQHPSLKAISSEIVLFTISVRVTYRYK